MGWLGVDSRLLPLRPPLLLLLLPPLPLHLRPPPPQPHRGQGGGGGGGGAHVLPQERHGPREGDLPGLLLLFIRADGATAIARVRGGPLLLRSPIPPSRKRKCVGAAVGGGAEDFRPR